MPSPDERPAARPRPSYGLPGPSAGGQSNDGAGSSRPSFGLPGAGSTDGTSGPGGTAGQGAPGQRPDQGSPFGAPAPSGSDGGAPSQPGSSGSQPPAPSGYVMPGVGGSGPGGPAGPTGAGTATRRRGRVPLFVGIALIVIALIVAIVGVILGVRNIANAVGDGPQTITDGSADVQLDNLEMLIVYVPAEDASTAECKASSPDDSVVETQSGGQDITFPNGDSYVQTLGVASTTSTTVTLDCTGTTSADAAYVGPINPMGLLVPLIGGPVLGVMIGLVGLVLTIVGIVLMVRSRRA
jgi:F0F1-type ATP synthase assembly protein I